MGEKPFVMTLGLSAPVMDFITPLISTSDVENIEPADIEKLIDEPPTLTPTLVLCGSDTGTLSPLEIAQFLRSQFQMTAIGFVILKDPPYQRDALLKNGFSESFVLAIDRSSLSKFIEDSLAKAGSIKSYRSVKLLDVEPDTTLDFDLSLYLPRNHKYIKYANLGDPITRDQTDKLKKHNLNSVYVTHDQLPRFYDYTAKRLQSLGARTELSATEKREQMQSAIRNLLTGVLGETTREGTFEQGKAMVTDCKKIVDAYVANSPAGAWYKRVCEAVDDVSDTFSHAGNVSTFAALFSLGLGIGKTEELAVAGLLHDIGLAQLPVELQDKSSEEEMTPEEVEEYRKHIDHTLELMRQRKLVLSDTIMKAITSHHERFNGTGYPKGLVGKRITIEAQLLAIADEFDDMIRVMPGKTRITPRQAVEQLKKNVTDDPGSAKHDPDLLKKLLSLFIES